VEVDMNIEEIEGVGASYGKKLSAVGVGTVEVLLEKGGRRLSREKLAEATGISEKLILEWVNRADLMRIKGVGSEYSDLLEAAGVDSCLELAHRVPANLHKKMEEVNAAKRLVRRLPTEPEVTQWVAAAKAMPKVVEH
jgi:predicted flap endonuclease-1-like 5' DNA nuclease